MASLREKVEAELEQMDRALRELPAVRLPGTVSLTSRFCEADCTRNRLQTGVS